MILSVAILFDLLFVSTLLTRTEKRRDFERMLYGYGNRSWVYFDLSDEAYAEMKADELVEKIGQTAIYGKLGDENQQYTYGAYLDKESEELEYNKLLAGHMPQNPGEAAIYDCVLEDLFFAAEPTEYLGEEITLTRYDFGTGNATGEKNGEATVKIVGIIESDILRVDKEINPGWLGYIDFDCMSMPVIYLYPDDCEVSERTHVFTQVRLYHDDILTEEQNDISLGFVMKYHEKCGKAPWDGASGEGIMNIAEIVTNYQVGNYIFTRIYPAGETTLMRYLSIIAIIMSSVSLFGIMSIVMRERIKSLESVRNVGCSKIRLAAILLTEWCLLLACGIFFGLATGSCIYELVLLIQKRFMGLSLLRGYHAEWAVLQVTNNPFTYSVMCATCMFALGYIIFFGCRWLSKKNIHKFRKKSRSRRRIFACLCGNGFSNRMQLLLMAILLFSIVMCYSYYTMDGKGDSVYFKEEESDYKNYYSYGHLDMKEADVDICIYTTGAIEHQNVIILQDVGIPAGTLEKLSGIEGVESVKACIHNQAFNVYYPKDDELVPRQIQHLKAIMTENPDPLLYADERDYYMIPAVFGNDTLMEKLSEYVTEGSIGTYKNGITVVFYEAHNVSEYPYKVGDVINSIAIGEPHLIHDMEAVIEAVAVIPETVLKTDPVFYKAFNVAFDGDVVFAAPQNNAVYMETYKENYDYVYITLEDKVSDKKVASEIRALLDTSMKVKIQTISDCDRAYMESRIARFGSILALIAVFFLMIITGYYSLVSMRLSDCTYKLAVLRTVGMPQKTFYKIFLLRNLYNTISACVLGTGMVYAMRWFLKGKYEKALDIMGYPEKLDLLGASEETYKKINDLNSRYLISHELHTVPVAKIIVILSMIILVISLIITAVVLLGKDKKTIVKEICE